MKTLLQIAAAFFIGLNLFIIFQLLQVQGNPIRFRAETQDQIALRAQREAERRNLSDVVFVQSLTGIEQQADDGSLQYEGVVRVVNEQEIGVPEAVVTLHLVTDFDAEIQQTITDDNGEGLFQFIIPPGNWRLEMLDITGGMLDYQKQLNTFETVRGVN